MNYVVKKNKKQWSVTEKQTDLSIRSFSQKKDAVVYLNFLNGGGAFDGFTPPFMVRG